MRVDHPRFFAYVPIPSNYVGMLADALVSGFGVFAGTWQADSLALDAHKWLFQPLEAGCVLVRDVAQLESIFSTSREFLLDAAAGDREVNFADRGLQLTRSFRAFKLRLCTVNPRATRENVEAAPARVEELAAAV
jgi:aromatic-L-amino-acid/L-tryptophan decarboxylase